ncbi:hypothetical protein AUP68_07982 [Ilyonectria robusta]
MGARASLAPGRRGKAEPVRLGIHLRGFSSTKCQTVVTSPSQLPRDFPRFTSPRLSSPQIPLLAEPRPDEPKACKISRVMIGQGRGKPEG